MSIQSKLSPKKLFLIDALGALLSAFLLGVVLVQFESIVGMPRETLFLLAALPCLFAAYDFACYFGLKENKHLFLKIIAIANSVYCIISVGFTFHHYQQLTQLGLLYFVSEILIVMALVSIEFKVAANSILIDN